MRMHNQWIAAYYPANLVEEQRVKSLFCLLFDKVICHFPIAHTGCGGGVGISDVYSDDPLVQAGVLELREEFLLDTIKAEFSEGYSWGTTEEFKRYHDLNATGMALICAQNENAVPVTEESTFSVPVSLLGSLDIHRAASLQAATLALKSLNLSLPVFATLASEDVLEAREKLKEQLIPFRAAMFALAPKVRAGIAQNVSIDALHKEATYLAETDILPRLNDLRRRLAMERGTFWRKLIQQVASHAPKLALQWMTGGTVAAAVDAARLAGGVGAQALESDMFAQQMLTNGGLGYLLSVEEELGRKKASVI